MAGLRPLFPDSAALAGAPNREALVPLRRRCSPVHEGKSPKHQQIPHPSGCHNQRDFNL